VFALPTTTDPVEALVNRTWKPTLSVTGAEGLPALQDAGNVLRPYTAFKLSLRLPPLIDAGQAVQELKTLLEDNAPYQAVVTFESRERRFGLERAAHHPLVRAGAQRRLAGALRRAGRATSARAAPFPLMNMLSAGFPAAQMMVCGRAGSAQQRARPNEFLHVPYAKRLTAAVAEVMAQMP
jgi:acetylornithine deacetylase/succinyl-diaminopimelate desuccinylase-like protein